MTEESTRHETADIAVFQCRDDTMRTEVEEAEACHVRRRDEGKMFRVKEWEASEQPPVAKLEGGSTGFIWQ